MVGFSGGGPAGCDRGRVGQQQEQHGGVGQRSQRQADHGEDVQRVRTPVRPGRRLTTGQFPTPRRIRSRRRCPTCWASVRTMASPRSPVGSGRCRTCGRRRIDWRSGGLRVARAGRAGSEVFGDQLHQRERDIGDPRRPCRGGAAQHPGGCRRDPGAGLPVAARWSPGLPTGVLRCSPHRSPARVSDPRDPLPRCPVKRCADDAAGMTPRPGRDPRGREPMATQRGAGQPVDSQSGGRLTGTAGCVPVNGARKGVSGCAGGGGGVCGSRAGRGRCGAARPGRGARGVPGWCR